MIVSLTSLFLALLAGFALAIAVYIQLLQWKPSNWMLTLYSLAWLLSTLLMAGMLGAR